MNAIDIALICKALSDSNRLQIVQQLAKGEKCACKLLEEFSITQPTLSHHMRILSECALVDTRKEGKWSHYSLHKETLAKLKDFLGELDCMEDSEAEDCGEVSSNKLDCEEVSCNDVGCNQVACEEADCIEDDDKKMCRKEKEYEETDAKKAGECTCG